jgi:signal transduction histidine kinase/CheY-like chemotaxis protein/HPt (histidine-containing phosphotransfer) domain-containing protein
MRKASVLVLGVLLLSLLLGVFGAPALAAQPGAKTELDLTPEEQAFLQEHPMIRLGVDPTFVPYEFIDSDGTYKGIAADYIALIEARTGLNMVITTGLTWAEAYDAAVKGEIDVLPCVGQTPEREKYFLFTDGYFTFHRAVFYNEETKGINRLEDLYGKTVAVQINSSHHSYMKDYPQIKLSLYPTVEQGLGAVSSGLEIAFVGNLATSSYLAKSVGIANLKYFTIQTDPNDPSQSLHFAVRKDWPELVSILNKALASITKEERTQINNKWIGVESTFDYADIIRVIEISGMVVVLIVVVSYFWIIRLRKEIKKRREAQTALVAAKEDAEQANEVKSLFLARMSHEIRTPLSAILGMSYLIKKTELSVTQGLYLDKLTQAARNMLGTINDILDFSKIEAGKITIEHVSFDLDQVLQRIINISSVKAEEQGIELNMDKDTELPTFFLGDPLRIEQVLLNLVNNAVKFTSQGYVRICVCEKSREGANRLVEFSVSDTGIGMSHEQLEHLFIPFDQGDSSISRRFGGSGLGLSIVKSLTELMNGEVSVTSEPGEGSTFTVCLPLEVDSRPERNEIKQMAADVFRRIRALVINSNESSGMQLAQYLRAFGITTDLALVEQEASKLVRKAAEEEEKPYNLIVVDFAASIDAGTAFVKKLRHSPYSNPSCKYVAVLPMSHDELREEMESVGVDFSILKPIVPSVLYNGIIEIFDISPPELQKPVPVEEDQAMQKHYAILLVEDNKTNQFIAKTILEQAGMQVSIASNGEEGCRSYEAHRGEIDLILMDLHMPVMDGYAASSCIRVNDPDIPIVAMTADAIAGVEEKCRSHGIYHYVSKPFEPEQLIETIDTILKNQRENQRGHAAESQPTADGAEGGALNAENGAESSVLNTADGLKRIGGNEAVYRLVLDAFAEENQTVGAELNRVIAAKDYDLAVQIVHKIKSSSGSIGAAGLHDTAAELQKALQEREETTVSRLHDSFQTQLAQLLREIQDYLTK